MGLVPPCGKERERRGVGATRKLIPLLLKGDELKEETAKAQKLKKVIITSRETSDVIMMAIGAFTPLEGFMTYDDWKGVCDDYTMADGTFWPLPITLSASKDIADGINIGEEITLIDQETDSLMATMKVLEKYRIDKAYESKQVFRTIDYEGHPGVAKVMAQGEINLAGPIKALSESYYPEMFKDIYLRPDEARKIFEEKGWSSVVALQLRNPMHRSHEYLAKIAIEICDGLFIHQSIGKLKEGDIPAEVRMECINILIKNYFVENTVVTGGYPMEMRYAGPREALLHACFRQNYGCDHIIIGRDHAGVGDYYGPFDAQKIFSEIPPRSLIIQPLKIDVTFFCYQCRGMASMRTCPHRRRKEDRLILSGTMFRKLLSEKKEIPLDFSRPEIVEILQKYYSSLDKKVEIKLHKHAEGSFKEYLETKREK